MTGAERARRYRVARGATDKVGRPRTAQCGTVSGYRAHVPGSACAACKAAWAQRQREYRRGRKANP